MPTENSNRSAQIFSNKCWASLDTTELGFKRCSIKQYFYYWPLKHFKKNLKKIVVLLTKLLHPNALIISIELFAATKNESSVSITDFYCAN